jgi:hypothetical protein
MLQQLQQEQRKGRGSVGEEGGGMERGVAGLLFFLGGGAAGMP